MNLVEENQEYINNDILNFTMENIEYRQHLGSQTIQENSKDFSSKNSFVKRFDDIAKTRDICNTYVQINDILSKFDKKIKKLLETNEKEFMIAYKDQMTQVQAELRVLKNKIDEETLKQKNDEKLKILEEERDYFRAEAIRLDKLCKEQGQQIEDFKFKIKLSQEEKGFYEGFVIETKKENNSLKTELINLYSHSTFNDPLLAKNRINQLNNQQIGKKGNQIANQESEENEYKIQSLQNIKQLQMDSLSQKNKNQFFSTQPTGFIAKENLKHQSTIKLNQLNEKIQILKYSEKKNQEIIQQLKQNQELDKQKMKKYQINYSKLITHRSELEEILLNCIDQAKKDIIKRNQQDKNTVLKYKQNLLDLGQHQFQNTDKRKLLLTFMSDDKVLESLYYLTFGVTDSDSQNNQLTKNWIFSVQDLNQKYKQFKNTAANLNLNRCIVTKDFNIDTKKTKSIIKQISKI